MRVLLADGTCQRVVPLPPEIGPIPVTLAQGDELHVVESTQAINGFPDFARTNPLPSLEIWIASKAAPEAMHTPSSSAPEMMSLSMGLMLRNPPRESSRRITRTPPRTLSLFH